MPQHSSCVQYNQVPRILNPVVHTLDTLPHLYKDRHARVHIDSIYGDLEVARLATMLMSDCACSALSGNQTLLSSCKNDQVCG